MELKAVRTAPQADFISSGEDGEILIVSYKLIFEEREDMPTILLRFRGTLTPRIAGRGLVQIT